ncbi:MAG: tetratricopeptide repeat-containing sulfotransferase family protein [Fimbriimonadaceae bacterium]
MSSETESKLAAAGSAHAAGKLELAERLAAEALNLSPGDVRAHLLLGVLAGKSGRDGEAIDHLQSVVSAQPDSFEALFWLSTLHRRGGKLKEAVAFARRAALVRPGDAYGQNNLGLCYLDGLDLSAAVNAFRGAASVRPDMAQIHHNLGTALYMQGRDLEAAKAFDRALALNPRADDSMLSLGQVMLSQTNPTAAAECARRALALKPNNPAALLLLASALVEDSRPSEAEAHLTRAIALNPQDAKAQALLGMRFQSMGRFEEANIQLRKSMEAAPKQGFAYFAYVHNNKISASDTGLVEQMGRLATAGDLPPRELDFLHYGLGRALESLGEYDKAIKHYDEANRIAYEIKFGDAHFDRDAYAAQFDRIIETFSQSSLEHVRGRGDASDLPIVIVGMMRSGTTLAEQILSSHPSVGAAGEDRFWPMNWRRALAGPSGPINAHSLRPLATEYVRRLRTVVPSKGRVTDKMPANYEFLGTVHAALPNARIIHMRRNPADTCFSIYATPNRVAVDFAYDRGNIAFAYEQYQRLMKHWRSVLPPERFLEIVYEELVSDREAVTRKLVEFCGLEWDDACLRPEQNERSVVTPSLWQVRQPIYTSSIGRWEKFRPWLPEFERLKVQGSE